MEIEKDKLKNLIDDSVICPRCQKYNSDNLGFLVKRVSSKGEFLGCTNYPICRYIVDIK
jgi:ssDNA-binding Zn-finger/Zn-ribbon topoisomerase 1